MIDEELKTRYRISKNSIEFIADLISEDIERDTKRNKAGVEFVFIIRSNRYMPRLLWDTSDLALGQLEITLLQIINSYEPKIC